MIDGYVILQFVLLFKTLITLLALVERLQTHVTMLMLPQSGTVPARVVAEGTFERFLIGMNQLVSSQRVCGTECLVTVLTLEGLFTSMHSPVVRETVLKVELLATIFALILRWFCVHLIHVPLQVFLCLCLVGTLKAFKVRRVHVDCHVAGQT